MGEPKLYRHNENGEVVAIAKVGLFANVLRGDGALSTHICKTITDNYTPLPEAPEAGSTAWAALMMGQGRKVRKESWSNKEYYIFMDDNCIVDMNGDLYGIDELENDWQLYEAPKLVIEKLPHEFMKGEKVLVRSLLEGWSLGYFKEFNIVYNKYVIDTKSSFGVCSESRCLPYEGNEHLEGTFIGEHEYGAVPKGYVPPHTPKLGDDDYWMVGDEIINLADGFCVKVYKVSDIIEWESLEYAERKGVIFYKNGCHEEGHLRVWFHKGSYVRDDGTVHEHIPTRPHKIVEGK